MAGVNILQEIVSREMAEECLQRGRDTQGANKPPSVVSVVVAAVKSKAATTRGIVENTEVYMMDLLCL